MCAAWRWRRPTKMLAVKQEAYVRAGVVNSAINIYIALDDWERARDLLALEATTSNTPHYYIGDLADVEEHLGNKQRSVELLAEAYAKAKGPASRFQWGYQYLDGLLRLTPDDLATIEKVGLQVMAELDGPNRVHRRTLSRLNKLDAKLREWNTSAARERGGSEAASHACRTPRRPDGYSSRRGRRALVRDAVRISRPRLASASRSSHSIWPLTLRSSWAASASIAAATAGSRRSRKAFLGGGSLKTPPRYW